jgi:hypothetical protein
MRSAGGQCGWGDNIDRYPPDKQTDEPSSDEPSKDGENPVLSTVTSVGGGTDSAVG